MKTNWRICPLKSALLIALLNISAVCAEQGGAEATPAEKAADIPSATQAEASPVPAEDVAGSDKSPLNLDKVVVTGAARKISKMKSSVSITTLDAQQVQNSGATNAAEVLRNVPGIRSESSGGDGNANMTVRGLPISAGGSRYLQMQEDGLPILQFGDIAFATPDMFMRVDQGLSKLEVVRGGTGSILGTNSPGGIINFINNTGEKEGGKIALSAGLNFQQWRTDFSYGTPLSEDLRTFVSGYYRRGEGLRDAGVTLEEGGQIKGNITKTLDNGFIRLNFKHLDDQTPTNLPLPAIGTSSGISQVAGINVLTGTLYGKSWPLDVTRGSGNQLISTRVTDGLTAKTDSVGAELNLNVAGWEITDKFRYADNRGRFVGVFPSSAVAANGDFTAVVFNTSLNDLGNTINDLRISRAFDLGDSGKITPSAGLYASWQQVALTWSFNQYNINAYNNTVSLANTSVNQWGNCCTRDLDATYRTLSPYASIAWEVGNWNFDAGVRRDDQKATGYYVLANAATGLFDGNSRKAINYDVDHTSYSIGANYRVNPNLALFGRASNGVAFNADRIMFGSANLNGGVIPINEVDQYELGVKWRQGNFNSFVTLFRAETDESNFDATTQKSTTNSYEANGVEVELGYSIDAFRVGGGFTVTDAEVVKAAAGQEGLVGKAPNRQADVIYQINSSYDWNRWTFGGNLIGTTDSVDNRDATTGQGVKLPAYAIANAYARFQYDRRLQLGLSVNNLFDSTGYTEAQATVARSVNGRSVTAMAVYSF